MSSYPPPGGAGPSGKTQVMGLDHKVAGLLAYVPCCIGVIFSILWLVTEPKDSRFVRFHSIQSLLIVVVWVIVWIVFWILFMILGVGAGFAPGDMAGAGIAFLLWIVEMAIFAILFILMIVCMIKAYQGQMWKVPMIGDIAEKNS
jgi:uncharacterized membrane protein